MLVDFPGGSDGNASAYNVEDLGSVPGLGRSPGEGKGYLLQCSGLEKSTDFTVHDRKESDTTERLSLLIHVSILFQIFFPFRFLQSLEQSSLCYTVGPC